MLARGQLYGDIQFRIQPESVLEDLMEQAAVCVQQEKSERERKIAKLRAENSKHYER